MKWTELGRTGDLRTFLLVLDTGDEAVETITAFAVEHDVFAASLTAIGAGPSITIGWFDPDEKHYRFTTFGEQVELASCIGDIADGGDGKQVLHAHVVAGRRDGSAIAGHLKAFTAGPTMEVVLTESPRHLRKRVDPEWGIALIVPPETS